MDSSKLGEQISEQLTEQKENFEKNWLTVVILWTQRLLLFAILFGAGWLLYYIFVPAIKRGQHLSWIFIPVWLLVAYAILPQIHRFFTWIYVPSYFIGRVRTTDGLLGDPVNIAATGEEEDVRNTLLAAGWIEAEKLSLKSSYKMIRSTLMRKSYPNAPVSSLMLFGKKQDLAFQQNVGHTTSQRHHVRLWKTPDGWMLPGGFKVDWVGAGTFDRSVGLSMYTLQITHKIAERTDEERDHIVKTVADTGMISGVEVIKNFASGYHHRNGGGDTIVTDGDLPIIHFAPPRSVKDRNSADFQTSFEPPQVMSGEEAYELLESRINSGDENDGRSERKFEKAVRRDKLDSPE
ncbi:MAG: LssY C-terminal domain-containing protein [Micrococcaceae bacterium]